MTLTELDVWEHEVPVIIGETDSEFEVWVLEAPIVGQNSEVVVADIRRRAWIF